MKHEAEQFNLFKEKDSRIYNTERPWKRSTTDAMLDLFLSGARSDRIAFALQRKPEVIERQLGRFLYNENGRAEKYEPYRRISRQGKPLSQNETIMIEEHRGHEVPFEATLRVLMRSAKEFEDHKKLNQVRELKGVAPTLDLVLALRYAHFVYKTSLVSDEEYDTLVKEEIEYGGGAKALADFQDPRDCPTRIKSLALYLMEKWEEEHPKEKK